MVTGVLFSLAFSLNALSMSWFATGMGRPSDIFRFETGPRVVIAVLSAGLILWSGWIEVYPILLALGTVGGVLAYNRRILGRLIPLGLGARSWSERLRHFLPAWGVEVVGSSYSSIPVPLSGGLLGASQTAPYVSADRVYRYGLFVVHALGNALQSWVLEQDSRRRHVIAIALHGILGVVGGGFLAIAGRDLSRFLFGDTVAPQEGIFVPLAIAFLSTSCSTPLMRNILIPRGKQRALLRLILAAGLSGITIMTCGGLLLHSIYGIVYGLAFSESALLLGACLLCIGATPAGRQFAREDV